MKLRPRISVTFGLLVVIASVASVRPLAAQTIENPRTVEFDPSPEHDVVSGGTPLVAGYEMEFFVLGSSQPVQTLALGKPAPAADGRIRVNFASLLTQPLPTGTTYTALVAAVGPGGRASSAVAPDLFTFTAFTAPCTFAVSPANPSALAAGGGSAAVTVATTDGCAWTASESVAWLSIASGSSGAGSGTVSYAATANTTTSPRSATLTVAGYSLTVTQNASPCSFAVSPVNPPALAAGGGSATVTVATTSGCAWTASESVTWLSIGSGSSGNGNGTVSYAATANTATSPRSTTLTVAGQVVTVAQAAASCLFTVSPATLSIAAVGGSASIALTTTSGCAWTSSEASSWLSITSGSNGSGSGSVTIAAAPNTTTSSRSTTLTAGGKSVVVTQPASGIPAVPTNFRIVGSGW